MTTLLVTGVNRGIGFRLASQALARGWRVIGTMRREAELERAAQSLPGAELHLLDVCDHAGIKALAAAVEEPVDILINNAGIIGPERQSPLDMDFAGFLKTLEVNTLAPLAMAQGFLPRLKAAEHGRIVTISSQMAWMGYAKADRIAYRASKTALNKVMQGLATDLREDGLSVCVIDPGWVRTDMGGDEADNAPADVAAGVLALADRLDLDGSGKFYKWSGEERPY